eukprot:15102-Heterococcus_DN1.PRE.2
MLLLAHYAERDTEPQDCCRSAVLGAARLPLYYYYYTSESSAALSSTRVLWLTSCAAESSSRGLGESVGSTTSLHRDDVTSSAHP